MLINTSTIVANNTTEDEEEAKNKFSLADFNNNNFPNKISNKFVTFF